MAANVDTQNLEAMESPVERLEGDGTWENSGYASGATLTAKEQQGWNYMQFTIRAQTVSPTATVLEYTGTHSMALA
jgi:hypothetical protein